MNTSNIKHQTSNIEESDLSNDEDVLAPEPSEAELSRQFTHPGYTFKGQELHPYTAGTDLLFNQVLDRSDSAMTVFLSFIFIHLKTWEGPKRRDLLSICWDKLAFRAALIEWMDSLGQLSVADKQEATRLFEDMRGWAHKSSIEVVPDPEQKKTRAKRRRTSPA